MHEVRMRDEQSGSQELCIAPQFYSAQEFIDSLRSGASKIQTQLRERGTELLHVSMQAGFDFYYGTEKLARSLREIQNLLADFFNDGTDRLIVRSEHRRDLIDCVLRRRSGEALSAGQIFADIANEAGTVVRNRAELIGKLQLEDISLLNPHIERIPSGKAEDQKSTGFFATTPNWKLKIEWRNVGLFEQLARHFEIIEQELVKLNSRDIST